MLAAGKEKKVLSQTNVGGGALRFAGVANRTLYISPQRAVGSGRGRRQDVERPLRIAAPLPSRKERPGSGTGSKAHLIDYLLSPS